jgi:hypothetical protein
MKENLIRIPRILSMAMALFLAVFAFDVWQEHNTILARAEALFIHLLPSILILISLFLCWKKPRIGAIIFTVLGIFYNLNEWGHWSAIGVIAIPLVVIGFLFWLAAVKNPPTG